VLDQTTLILYHENQYKTPLLTEILLTATAPRGRGSNKWRLHHRESFLIGLDVACVCKFESFQHLFGYRLAEVLTGDGF
jgi:hypothetical protein